MNYDAVIADLRAKARALLECADALERLNRTPAIPAGVKIPGRRGRRSMPASERQEVSERMKRYWAKRQRERAAGGR